ncbi:hypothetical protein WICMUC_005693 [Wickerhamomyces mucosus]|uniref:Uncharacterized protein n=1 Tax=Wickerhamomyces mucosus TaxID=1378264 RepID=A0A9P8T5U2_9ASCO|nr:hypothetical protein WICMUC_005693 [Wickerhamomyces mucosus]
MKYVIEHMEQGFSEWVILEYSQIIREIGKENLFLTSLPEGTTEKDIPQALKDLGLQWTTKGVNEIGTAETPLNSNRVCILDPKAETDLIPEDANGYDWLVFGGILGSHPPRDLTQELIRKYGYTGKRLGDKQMTTDTAVRTTNLILEKQTKFEDIKFIDYPEFRFNKSEAVEMPFRYILNEQGRPILPEGMFALIKKDSEQSLDDLLA